MICLPGNIRSEVPLLRMSMSSLMGLANNPAALAAPMGPGKIPSFTMGYEDGESLRGLIEQAPAGRGTPCLRRFGWISRWLRD